MDKSGAYVADLPLPSQKTNHFPFLGLSSLVCQPRGQFSPLFPNALKPTKQLKCKRGRDRIELPTWAPFLPLMAPLRGEGDFDAGQTTGFGGPPADVFLFRERGWVGELGDSAGGNVIWVPGMCLRSRANICFSSDAILVQSSAPPHLP